MSRKQEQRTELDRMVRYSWMLAGFWTVFVISVLFWNLYFQRRETLESAYLNAQAAFEKDVLYRRWSAGHGGTYAPITTETPPNPYLAHIEERDITTPSGRQLTLINPAYMTPP